MSVSSGETTARTWTKLLSYRDSALASTYISTNSANLPAGQAGNNDTRRRWCLLLPLTSARWSRANPAKLMERASKGSRFLHLSNLERTMSALGQKQTLCEAILMSALPPKADMERGSPECPLIAKSGHAEKCHSALIRRLTTLGIHLPALTFKTA